MKKIMILVLCLTATVSRAQLVNAGFEDWTTDAASANTYPTGWDFYGSTLDMAQTSNFCYQVTPAQLGSYALGVSVWYYYVKSVAVQRVAITTRPTTLEGYYKYTNNTVRSIATNQTITDTAIASISLTKWNDATMQADTIGQGQIMLGANAGYSHFICPINYTGTAVPDSATVIFDPSIVRRNVNVTDYQSVSPDGRCSYLTIDNLWLGEPAAAVQVPKTVTMAMYPNPATNHITIKTGTLENYTVYINDMAGKRVLQSGISPTLNTIAIDNLAAGVYIVSLQDSHQQAVARKKLIKQ